MTVLDRPQRRQGSVAPGGFGSWRVVAGQELRDTWLAGRALPLMLGYAVLLSVTTYLVAINQELNYLEQRESAGLVLQVAVAVGGLLALLGAADAFSGERERGTLESLLLTPVPRRALVVGKGVAALSLWFGAYVVSLPYVWYLGHDVDAFWVSAGAGLLVGTLLALFLVGLGLVLSVFAQSNRLSLSVGLFVLLALYAPTQMPTAAQQGWVGDVMLHVDPIASGLRFLGRLVSSGHGVGQEVGWIVGPVVAAVLAVVAAIACAGRLALRSGERS